MAVVNDITAENSRADLLEGSTTSGLANKFTSDNLENIVTEFKDKINAEISKGLSPKALSLEGRAPLNDIAVEMLARIEVTANDLADAKTITLARGNNHTIQEADKFLKEVVKKYGELCQEAKNQASYYNNQATRTEYEDEDGDGKKEEHQVHPKGKITITYTAEVATGTTERIEMKPESNPDGRFDREFSVVKAAYEKAAKFFDGKVKEAVDFWVAAKDLTVPSTGSTPLAIPNDEKLPYGVQPDAKKIVTGDTRHGTITYINPDGSKVIITEGVNGNNEPVKTHRVINRHGYIDESIIYNKDGSIDHKNKYKYKKIGDGVYQTTQEQYKYTDGEFEKEPSTINDEYGYAYRANGKVEYSKQLPEEVGSTDTSEKGSTRTVVDKSGGEYIVPKDFDDLKDNIVAEHKDFYLIRGQKLVIDDKDDGARTYCLGRTYYKYNSEDDKYYICDENGKQTGTTGFSPEDLLWENSKKDSSNDSKLKMNTYAQNQIDQFYEGNIPQEEMTDDKHAWKLYQQQQKTWVGNPPGAKSDAKTYDDLTPEEQQEFDAGFEEVTGKKQPPLPPV